LRPRAADAHKGDFGHVLVVGGAPGMPGAARLAAEAAARSGAGLVSVATHAAHAAVLNNGRPELMVRAVDAPAQLADLLARATVVAVGPGLGRGAWGRALFEQVLESGLPLVVDADALNCLAADPLKRDDWVLTPHPGEAARLLQSASAAVQADRFAAVTELQARYGGVAVLKGAGTLVAGGGVPLRLCALGNPGMASGGMGDVLTGVIAALRAQGLAPLEAACSGVCLHAGAADALAATRGERGLLAGDLIPEIRRLLNERR
jgi:NAD(P)H-hydrate epimerase